jgi:hypothetical protein
MMPEDQDVLESQTVRVRVGCGSLFVTVIFQDDTVHDLLGHVVMDKTSCPLALNKKVCGIKGTLGKAGGCEIGFIEGVCRVVSTGLRNNIPPEEFAKNLAGIQCPKPAKWGKKGGFIDPPIMSCVDALAKVLWKFSGAEPIVKATQETATDEQGVSGESLVEK